jgi:hypothetical protein
MLQCTHAACAHHLRLRTTWPYERDRGRGADEKGPGREAPMESTGLPPATVGTAVVLSVCSINRPVAADTSLKPVCGWSTALALMDARFGRSASARSSTCVTRTATSCRRLRSRAYVLCAACNIFWYPSRYCSTLRCAARSAFEPSAPVPPPLSHLMSSHPNTAVQRGAWVLPPRRVDTASLSGIA